ncbi:MAG: 2-phospho-L-lactate guanylyltransferase [Caldilineales bacterium]|nr:2-phospho-L-lactate guanylyltransferase [Caldilineales bacterium]
MNRVRVAVATPMKPLAQAKQRLRPAIDDPVRQQLAKDMFRHVLSIIAASGVADVAGVVASDPEVLALAAEMDFEPISEIGFGYNDAVSQAGHWAQMHAADILVILPGDLPQLSVADVRKLALACMLESHCAVIAPDQHETGTNALALRPPRLLLPHFGPQSFAGHCALARMAGVEPVILRTPGLAFDVDLPADLNRLLTVSAAHLPK